MTKEEVEREWKEYNISDAECQLANQMGADFQRSLHEVFSARAKPVLVTCLAPG